MLDPIFYCLCGARPSLASNAPTKCTPFQYRLTCRSCGQTSPQWSTNITSTIGHWNKAVATTIGQILAAYRL